MQHELHTFGGGQAVHHDVQRDADRLGQQDLLLGRRRPTPGFRKVAVVEQLVEVDFDWNLRRVRRLLSMSRQTRLVTVVNQARRSSMPSPPARLNRSQAS